MTPYLLFIAACCVLGYLMTRKKRPTTETFTAECWQEECDRLEALAAKPSTADDGKPKNWECVGSWQAGQNTRERQPFFIGNVDHDGAKKCVDRVVGRRALDAGYPGSQQITRLVPVQKPETVVARLTAWITANNAKLAMVNPTVFQSLQIELEAKQTIFISTTKPPNGGPAIELSGCCLYPHPGVFGDDPVLIQAHTPKFKCKSTQTAVDDRKKTLGTPTPIPVDATYDQWPTLLSQIQPAQSAGEQYALDWTYSTVLQKLNQAQDTAALPAEPAHPHQHSITPEVDTTTFQYHDSSIGDSHSSYDSSPSYDSGSYDSGSSDCGGGDCGGCGGD